jgi:hypothetical protein
MTWFYIDDGFVDHPKVLAIPKPQRARAVGIWTQCGVWCARHLTDGYMPPGVPGEYGARPADVALLVDCRVRLGGAGLWERVEGGGLLFHDWTIWQKSREEIEARRATRAAAGRLGGRASGVSRGGKKGSKPEANPKQVLPPDAPDDEANASAVVPESFDSGEADTNPGPARPVPAPKGPGTGPGRAPQPPGPPAAGPAPAGPGVPPAVVDSGPEHLTGEAITVLGALMPETAWEKLDHAAIDGVCTRLALNGWTRTTLATALHERSTALGKSRGAGLAMSVLRDLDRAHAPANPACPNRCTNGLLEDDAGRPHPCPTCRPGSARRVAEQRAQTYDYGPRAPGREAS